MHIFDVTNSELMEALTLQARERGITNAAIVSLIGGVDSFTVSTMPADDASQEIVSSYSLPAEMHGSGEIKDGEVHVHATMAVQGDRAVAGHLYSAQIATFFARAYVISVD